MPKSIKVTIGKKKIVVYPATIPMDVKKSRLLRYALENPREDEDEQVAAMQFYPTMAACSKGDVPTIDEFMNISRDDLEDWYQAVDKLNPDGFPFSQRDIVPNKKKEK
jgi:hypothetical protein